MSGSNVAFQGLHDFTTSDVKAIYALIKGSLRLIVDNTMVPPGGTAIFYRPDSSVMDGEDIAFTDSGSNPNGVDAQERSYTYFDGTLDVGILGAPVTPGSPARAGRALVSTRGPGIIRVAFGGQTLHVIGTGDVLDGKIVSLAYQSRESISDVEIVFLVLFEDGSQGIYVASIPLHCGNGILDPGEECDDGNQVSGDGCSASCRVDEVVIPTVSVWGLVVFGRLLCTTARLRFRVRPVP